MEQNAQNSNENYQPNFNRNDGFLGKESEQYNAKPADPIMEPQPEVNQKDIDNMTDEEYKMFIDYHLSICEREDLIGYSGHILSIIEK